MMTYQELVEAMGEAEIAYISASFWGKFFDLPADRPIGPPTESELRELLVFQNGYYYAQQFYT